MELHHEIWGFGDLALALGGREGGFRVGKELPVHLD
jgi:hypothetical protein